MTSVSKLMLNKQPLPNIRFWDDNKIGSNIFFVPESISKKESDSALKKFLDTQVKAYYQTITVPNIITNFLGKKLSSQKYYLHIKKEMPNFLYNRTPGKSSAERTNIFDFSGIIDEIVSITKSRSSKLVFTELNKFIGSAIKDYDSNRLNILLIAGNPLINSGDSDFLNLLIYINKLNAGKIKSSLDGIVYLLNNKYYPIAIKDEDAKLKFLKNIIGQVIQIKDKTSKGNIKTFDIEETKEKIEEIAKNAKNEEAGSAHKEIKKLLLNHPELSGTFDEKVNQLFDSETYNKISNLSSYVNKKYNGNIELNIPHKGVFDAQKIVGMDEVGNYNKQKTELTENVDELVEDLIHGTLENDPDVDIKVLSIKTKILDDNKNRFKEFQVRIKHTDFGNTTNKPYTISFRIPVPVNGKYIKIGGNNYILINQLFPKPIQKVAPNLVRFYTHFSVASLKIKNAKLNASNGFNELEEKFVQQLKSVNAIKLENMTNVLKDDVSLNYGLDDLHDFKYSKMTIKA